MTGIEKTITLAEALASPEKTGEKVCIINGGLEGIKLGIYLASLGRIVTIVEQTARLSGSDNNPYIRDIHYRMVSAGIDARCNSEVTGINNRGVECGGGFIEADTVVYDTVKK